MERDLFNFNYIDVVRLQFNEKCTIGQLYLNDVLQCYTLEPPVRNRYGLINPGEYDLRLDIVSPKYRFRYPYRSFCEGKLPRIMDVPCRDGLLIHIGNVPADTLGCVLVGQKIGSDGQSLINSTKAFIDLYNKLRKFNFPTKIVFDNVS